MVLDQGPVEAGVQRVHECVSIRSRASLTEGCGATWVDVESSSLKPLGAFDTDEVQVIRVLADGATQLRHNAVSTTELRGYSVPVKNSRRLGVAK